VSPIFASEGLLLADFPGASSSFSGVEAEASARTFTHLPPASLIPLTPGLFASRCIDPQGHSQLSGPNVIEMQKSKSRGVSQMANRRWLYLLVLALIPAHSAYPQSSTTSSAAAGLAAGAALGAGAAQSATTASTAGGSNAPIEMNIMVYGGLKQIALKIASDVDTVLPPTGSTADWKTPDTSPSDKPCSAKPGRKLLLEDTASAPQIALYKTFDAYRQNVLSLLTAKRDEVDRLRKQIQDLTTKDQDEKKKADEEAAAAAKKAEEEKKKEEKPGIRALTTTTPTPAATTTGGGAATPTTGGGTSTAPVSLTYLSDISSAIGAAKNGITYTASSIQPTTQALTTELAKDLCSKGIGLYSSTSPVNPPEPNEIISQFNDLVVRAANIQSKVYVSPPTMNMPANKDQAQSLASEISSRATEANQLMASFQTWLSSSDGGGNITLTDVIRGYTLNRYIGDGIPALQFTIDAAGGNTRTNSFFLLNLFYTPRPSFNGGVVVTFELRDKENTYIAGDTLKVLYNYSKWKPKSFVMSEGPSSTDGTSLGTGR